MEDKYERDKRTGQWEPPGSYGLCWKDFGDNHKCIREIGHWGKCAWEKIKRFELWWGEGSWRRPSEWVFQIDRNCSNGCIIIELGFFGITILKNHCKRIIE